MELRGVKIWDKNNPSVVYYTQINLKEQITHSRPVSTVIPLNTKYPMATKFGRASYYRGTISAAFENNTNTQCQDDYDFGDVTHRLSFIEFLHNGKTKILQLSDTFQIQIVILGDVTFEMDNTINDKIVGETFEWEQTG